MWQIVLKIYYCTAINLVKLAFIQLKKKCKDRMHLFFRDTSNSVECHSVQLNHSYKQVNSNESIFIVIKTNYCQHVFTCHFVVSYKKRYDKIIVRPTTIKFKYIHTHAFGSHWDRLKLPIATLHDPGKLLLNLLKLTFQVK